ncbi:MAG TPA: TOPRIM nucleotidyl transferase/hydrolase domain-containing protein [Gaiellaceae bacterium]|nr:TOPRIM nucleotidyl transferase/hydrolase domain-containing protein [Gaiellaceae bacterium]
MDEPRAHVLVEGLTDRIALETAAARLGRDLAAEGVQVVELGGAHAIGGFLAVAAPRRGVRLAGLCDAREEPVFRRALARAGVDDSRFHVCVRDLEEELIRAVGADAVLRVLDEHGDLASFRTFERQPAWRGRPLDEQLRRFLCSSSRRNARYARHLVEALPPARIPAPLRAVLDSVR